MNKFLALIPLSCLALLAGQAASPLRAQSQPTTYYVDFEKGNDTHSGLDAHAAWKHAPGDPQATGKPRMQSLRPGDTVNFAAGVVYRGQIEVRDSGQPGKPIVFQGASGAEAIISGSDLIEFKPCVGQPACTGAPSEALLLQAGFDHPGRPVIFSNQGMLRESQYPDPSDDLYPDEPEDMLSIPSPELAQGSIRAPVGVPNCLQDCRGSLALWTQGNTVIYRKIDAISGGIARFNVTGINFYDDRPTRYAWVGFLRDLNRPTEFLAIGERQFVVRPAAGISNFEAATGRGGFNLRNASWVSIRNLSFERMSDGGVYGKGIGIFSNAPGSEGITIEANRFRQFDLASGTGVINLRGVNKLTIRNNRIDHIVRGSGIRLSGPSQTSSIKGNRIKGIGRTAIYVSTMDDVDVSENFIEDVRGVHGNGLSAYLANHGVSFRRNTVIFAKQPATFHGSGSGDTVANRIVFAENLLIGVPDGLGSLISWGQQTRDVTIKDNILLGARFGLRMHISDEGLRSEGNIGVPPAPTAPIDSLPGARSNRWSTSSPYWMPDLIQFARREKLPTKGERSAICRSALGKDARGKAIGSLFECD